MDCIKEEFIKQNAEKQFEKLKRKYKNKKIVLYGAGIYFEEVRKNFDLSQLNIIAVSDRKYENKQELTFDEVLGYNVISPYQIYTLNPDIVLLTVQEDFYIEEYICNEIYQKTKHKFKYRRFFKLTLEQIIENEFMGI